MLLRTFLDESPATSEPIRKGVDLCLRLLPTWAGDGSIDMYYWTFGSLAMRAVGGEPWARWSEAMETAAFESQRSDGDPCGYFGSWDPVDPWGADGGRVYATAMMTLCLEAPYRYPRAE